MQVGPTVPTCPESLYTSTAISGVAPAGGPPAEEAETEAMSFVFNTWSRHSLAIKAAPVNSAAEQACRLQASTVSTVTKCNTGSCTSSASAPSGPSGRTTESEQKHPQQPRRQRPRRPRRQTVSTVCVPYVHRNPRRRRPCRQRFIQRKCRLTCHASRRLSSTHPWRTKSDRKF